MPLYQVDIPTERFEQLQRYIAELQRYDEQEAATGEGTLEQLEIEEDLGAFRDILESITLFVPPED